MFRNLITVFALGTTPAAHAADQLIFSLGTLHAPGVVVTDSDTKVFLSGEAPGIVGDIPGHRQIFGVFCTPFACPPVELVIPFGDFANLDNPDMVQKAPWTDPETGNSFPAYILAYFDCSNVATDICFSVSFTGHEWSAPQLLIPNAKEPSAIVIKDQVFLWATTITQGNPSGQMVYNLNYTGISYDPNFAHRVVYDPPDLRLSNVDVRIGDPEHSRDYHLLAQQYRGSGRKFIDEFVSDDGLNFRLLASDILPPSASSISNEDPTFQTPDTILYTAKSWDGTYTVRSRSR